MGYIDRWFPRGCALAVLLLVAGCATVQPTRPVEPLLTEAGFKPIVASSAALIKHLQTLPSDEMTVVQRNGRTFFVYPEPSRNQIYVGTEREYRAYLQLRVANNMPENDPHASYFKQDRAMAAADAQGASDPWELWQLFTALQLR